MQIRPAAAALAVLALAACGEAQTNISNAAAPEAETGDLNSAIGGDEISPIPEAEDDLAANMSGTGNVTAPPPPAPGSNSVN